MRKVILPIIISSLLFGGAVLAQEAELPEAGLTPDSPFYFLETIVEEVVTFFTFGDLKKAERYALLAAERLAEAESMAEGGKPKHIEKTLERYGSQLNKSAIRAEKAMNAGKDFETVMAVIAKAGRTTSVHLEVLTEVYEKVPEEAKSAIEDAIAASVKRHGEAVRALKGSNDLGDIPEEAPMPAGISEEARERIQRKVEVKTVVEKALQVSGSTRDLCTKTSEQVGGPQGMCELIPARGFKSFEGIRTFCAEAGGPPEACAMLESMCREQLGITEPDDCFRALMTASTEAYTTGIETHPAEVRPEIEAPLAP